MDRAFFAVVVAVALGLLSPQPAHAVVPPIKQPSWVELTPDQREMLAPLAGEWDQFEFSRRKKWLGIAERYPAMKADEQARVQRRMLEWVKLSPEQRKLAREKFKNLQKAPPEHKETVKQKWQEYKELPDEEKQRLQAEAAAKEPKARNGPKGSPFGTGKKPGAAPLPALGTASPLQSPQTSPEPAPPVPPTPAAPATSPSPPSNP